MTEKVVGTTFVQQPNIEDLQGEYIESSKLYAIITPTFWGLFFRERGYHVSYNKYYVTPTIV